MNLLLDTHAVIWLYHDDLRLGKSVRAALGDADMVFVSFVSAWEYAIKRRKRPAEFVPAFAEMCRNMPVSGLGLDYALHEYADSLPAIHKDPFDRMLIAQAIYHDLILVTTDTDICRYSIATIW